MTAFAALRRLARLAAPALPHMAAGALLAGLAALSAAGLMTTAAWLIASAALQPPFYTLSLAIVGVRACGLARAALRYGERCVAHDATFRLLSRLRQSAYAGLAALPPDERGRRADSDLADLLLRRIDVVKDFYLRALLPISTALGLLAALAAFFSCFAPRLALWLPAAFAAIGALLPALLRRRPDEAASPRLANFCADAIGGLAELAAGNRANATIAALERLEARESQRLERAELRRALLDALCNGAAAVGVVGALCILIPMTHDGALTGVQLAALLLALQSGLETALALPGAWKYGAAAVRAVREIPVAPPAETTPAAPPSFPPDAPLLELRDLRFAYPGQAPLLRGVSFALRAGERVALVGASGAGKSTLLALLLKLRAPDGGTLLLRGVSYADLPAAAVRDQLAAVSQATHLFQRTLRDHFLRLHGAADAAAMRRALESAALGPWFDALPLGLDTPIGQNGALLSGGQQRRLALATALLRDAPLLLLDEPTAQLDRRTAAAVLQTILCLPGRRALLLVTHDDAALAAMDRIIVLENGRVVETGTYETLRARRGSFCRLLQNSG